SAAFTSISDFLLLLARKAPKAAPKISVSSKGWYSAPKWPPSAMKLPTTDTATTRKPITINTSGPCQRSLKMPPRRAFGLLPPQGGFLPWGGPAAKMPPRRAFGLPWDGPAAKHRLNTDVNHPLFPPAQKGGLRGVFQGF